MTYISQSASDGSGIANGLGKKLTDALGKPVTVSGPSSPTHPSYMSRIKIYLVNMADVRLIVRDYRDDPALKSRGIEVVGDIEKRNEVVRTILSYLN